MIRKSRANPANATKKAKPVSADSSPSDHHLGFIEERLFWLGEINRTDFVAALPAVGKDHPIATC
jgi:hypothetical protein